MLYQTSNQQNLLIQKVFVSNVFMNKTFLNKVFAEWMLFPNSDNIPCNLYQKFFHEMDIFVRGCTPATFLAPNQEFQANNNPRFSHSLGEAGSLMPPSETRPERRKHLYHTRYAHSKIHLHTPSRTMHSNASNPSLWTRGYFFLCCQSPSQSLLLTHALIRRQMACGFKISHWMYTCMHESIFLCTIAHVFVSSTMDICRKVPKIPSPISLPLTCNHPCRLLLFHHPSGFPPWSVASSRIPTLILNLLLQIALIL